MMPDRDRDEQRQHLRVDHQHRRHRDAVLQDRADALAGVVRAAQVTGGRVGEPLHVPDRDRLVEVQVLPDLGAQLRVGVLRPEDRLERVAEQVEGQERQQRDGKEHHEQLRKPAE